MNSENSRMAIMGVTNTTTMTISKIVAFTGSILAIAGFGGMVCSRRYFNEAEMDYLMGYIKKK